MGTGLVLAILILGGALLWQNAFGQSTSGDKGGPDKPPVTIGQAEQPARKKSDTPDPQKKLDMPADDAELWSLPVDGLQARLRVERRDVINGTPLLNVLLDLRNVSEPKQVIHLKLSRPLDERLSQFNVTDAAGNNFKMYNGPYDGVFRGPETIKIKAGDTLTYDITGRGVGIPANEALLLDLGSSHNWVFKAGDKTSYYLHAQLGFAGFGILKLPKVRIPTSSEVGYLKATIRGRLVHEGRDYRLMVRSQQQGTKELGLIFRSNADKGFQSGMLLTFKNKEVFASGAFTWLSKDHQVNSDDDWGLGLVFADPKQLKEADDAELATNYIKVQAKGTLICKDDGGAHVVIRLQENPAKELTIPFGSLNDRIVRKLTPLKDKQVIVTDTLRWDPSAVLLFSADFDIIAADVKSQKKSEGESGLGGLPDQDRVQWDLKALEPRFKIISTSMPSSESKDVCLLLEAKEAGIVKVSGFRTSLFDKDKVRIQILYEGPLPEAAPCVWMEGGIPANNTDDFQVAAGERVRVYLRLPPKTTWQNVRNVMVGTSDVPR
jgi:hypothetical protein